MMAAGGAAADCIPAECPDVAAPEWREWRTRLKRAAAGSADAAPPGTNRRRRRQLARAAAAAAVPETPEASDVTSQDVPHGVLDVLAGDEQVEELAPDRLPEAYAGPLFGIRGRPGFVLAPGALSDQVCRVLTHLALTRYCEPPHRTNLDAHKALIQEPPETAGATGEHKESRSPKLAWASLGFHFDWTKRSYTDDMRGEMPLELQHLTARFARALGSGTYRAEAAIVNYYRGNSNMGPHVDDSEDDEESPVVSISLGRSAVFLLGTTSRADPPIPVLLRHGDVMMLSGPARLCVHGVAGILPRRIPVPAHRAIELAKSAVQSIEEVSPPFAEPPELHTAEIEQVFASQRININVRQVLLPGEAKLLPRPGPSSSRSAAGDSERPSCQSEIKAAP